MQPYIVYRAECEPYSQVSEASGLIGKRVVIVEDEGVTQLQLRTIIEGAGMHVVGTAVNGMLGVEVTLRERPDLVLMDIRIPVLDGIQAAQQILDVYEVCIVMVTAFSDEAYRREADKIGACGYVVKPVAGNTLLPEIQALLAQFRSAN